MFSGAVDVSMEAELRHERRRRSVVITHGFVPLSVQKPGPFEFGKHENCSIMPSTIVTINSSENALSLVPSGSSFR